MPLYFTEGGEPVFAQINAACDAVERDTGVKCSIHFRVLVFNALISIVEDPSAAWQANPSMRQVEMLNLLDRLPSLMFELARSESVEGRLTYFDGIHWLTEQLDTICPFEKSPRRRSRRERR